MEDGVPVFAGKPALAVVHHYASQRMNPKYLAEISSVALAIDAVTAFSIKDWNYLVASLHIHNTFSYTLNDSILPPKKEY